MSVEGAICSFCGAPEEEHSLNDLLDHRDIALVATDLNQAPIDRMLPDLVNRPRSPLHAWSNDPDPTRCRAMTTRADQFHSFSQQCRRKPVAEALYSDGELHPTCGLHVTQIKKRNNKSARYMVEARRRIETKVQRAELAQELANLGVKIIDPLDDDDTPETDRLLVDGRALLKQLRGE